MSLISLILLIYGGVQAATGMTTSNPSLAIKGYIIMGFAAIVVAIMGVILLSFFSKEHLIKYSKYLIYGILLEGLLFLLARLMNATGNLPLRVIALVFTFIMILVPFAWLIFLVGYPYFIISKEGIKARKK